MRKGIYSIIILLGIAVNGYSQDIITPAMGKDIRARIIEVGITEITYKTYDNLNGPTRTIPRNDVLIICYEDGTKELLFRQTKAARDSGQIDDTKDSIKTVAEKQEPATITLSTGEDIQGRVVEINDTAIVYKPFSSLIDTVLSVLKSEVLIISYADGSKELMYKQPKVSNKINEIAKTKLNSVPAETVKLSKIELRDKGINDSRINYRGKRSGAILTGVASFVFTPVIGIIPAVACAVSIPKERNLNFTDDELKRDYEYNKAYVKEARRTKATRVLAGYLVGSITWLAVIFL